MTKTLILLALLALPFGPAHALYNYTVDKVDSIYPWNVVQVGLWTTIGCAAGQEWDCVNEYGSTSDENTSYLTINNSAGIDQQRFRSNTWVPSGLTEIDSVYLHAWGMKTGGAAGAFQFHMFIGGTPFGFDATGTLPTSTYTHYEGDQIQNPDALEDWTVETINQMSWGVDRSTNPSAGESIRVSQVFLEIFWKQLKQADTIDSQSELLDTYMASGPHTNKNFGANTVTPVGRATSNWTGRPMFFIDSVFWTNWQLYFIDSAWLDLKTESVYGGTHDIVAHTVTWGGIAGTANGTTQNGSTCWNYSRYHSEVDARRDWGADGADSCGDQGGRDRNCDSMSMTTVSVDETVYPIPCGEWLNIAAGFDWTHHYGYLEAPDIGWNFATLPIILRLKQNSEALPDTQIQFYSMDHGTAGNRPRIRVFGTRR